MKPQICIENLSYRPESLPPDRPDILRGISLEIQPGEWVGIIGANGSGKTTFIKHINGLLTPTGGRVLVDGYDTRAPENWQKIRARVGMVFQDPREQIVASTVEEDIAFGLENANLPTSEIQKRVREQCDFAGLMAEAQSPPHLLSGGQTQKLALAGVLARQPDVILFDEPTTMLDPRSRQRLLEKIRDLHQQGLTILFITQDMQEVLEVDRLLVFAEGRLLMQGPPLKVFSQKQTLKENNLEQPLRLVYAARFRQQGWELSDGIPSQTDLLAAIPNRHRGNPTNNDIDRNMSPASADGNAQPDPIIDADNLHYTYLAGTQLARKALKGVSLAVPRQGLEGLAGANGSGKSTLLQHVNGLLRPEQGSLYVKGLPLHKPETSLSKAVRNAGLVFQNPETQFFEPYVGDEIAFGPKQFEMTDIRERVRKAMTMLGLDFETYKDRRLETLSGGEKRKVALASTLVLDQDILLFDEPTAGMDPRSREDFTTLIRSFQKNGKTILISSHQLDEILRLCGHISIMCDGQVLLRSDFIHQPPTEEILREAGLNAPLSLKIRRTLHRRGWTDSQVAALSSTQFAESEMTQ